MSEQLTDWAREATEPTSFEVARLQASVRAGDPTRARRLVPAIAVGAVVALVLAFALTRPSGPTYTAPAIGTQLALSEGAQLGPSIILSGAGTALVTRADTARTVVTLEEGRLVAEVNPEGAYRSFTVRAPGDVEVHVVGTKFTVAWEADAGEVSVERGRVAVYEGTSGPSYLQAGESWTWDGGAAVEEESRDHLMPGVTDGAPEPPDGGARQPDPASDVPERGMNDRPTPSREAPAPTPEGADSVSAAVSDPEAVAVVDPLPEPPGAPTRTDDLAAARAFGLVVTAAEQRDWSTAADLADRFIATHPSHSLTAEAGYVRIDALSHSDPQAAVDTAASWLNSHPRHPRRADVLFLHATIAYDRLGDCSAALPSYTELIRLTAGERQAKAFAFQGLCAKELGQSDLARSAIDAALNHSDLPRALTSPLKRAERELPTRSTP